jgi:tetratricopeptide (TPR) repeat protein
MAYANAHAAVDTKTAFANGAGGASVGANALNGLAWQQVNDPDPAKRKPDEALRNAEKAMELEPKNAQFLNTRGVARYRLGDCIGAIDDLERGIALRKFNGHDGFFLAMSYARLGDLAKAEQLFDQSDEWAKQADPENSELKRFREEAAFVLYITRRSVSRKSPTSTNEPRTKQSSAQAPVAPK